MKVLPVLNYILKRFLRGEKKMTAEHFFIINSNR